MYTRACLSLSQLDLSIVIPIAGGENIDLSVL